MPLAVLAATDTIPSALMLNGPVVNGVTLVFVVVITIPFIVSFVNALIATTTLLFETVVTEGSFIASITFATVTLAVAVSQFAGDTFNPVDGSASHNW